ncbi:hypothetical protein OHA37_00720 [Streptomyces sp. NBC_00335]|uniref:hypothetical protein n=1 Tax=unclassified Streptomyces TaxID=2593676 RepID=UPI0022579605|nr:MULTISPECIES: hypothetical protein [unclassified Streptomyces]MCX5410288.1 hypothetical protein [Streptomyces sp. NBC_00086]
MRIPKLLGLLAVAAALAGCTGQGEEPAPQKVWEPDDALQRAQAALKDPSAQRVRFGSPHVASGMDETLETGGDKPYRFDVVCDSSDVRKVTVSFKRGQSTKQTDVACATTTRQQPARVNIPAGGPVTVTIAPQSEDLTGLIVWELRTVDPTKVQGCADDISGC